MDIAIRKTEDMNMICRDIKDGQNQLLGSGIALENIMQDLNDIHNKLSSNPRDYDLRLKLGSIYDILGDFPRAAREYLTASYIRPDDATAYEAMSAFLTKSYAKRLGKELVDEISIALEDAPWLSRSVLH